MRSSPATAGWVAAGNAPTGAPVHTPDMAALRTHPSVVLRMLCLVLGLVTALGPLAAQALDAGQPMQTSGMDCADPSRDDCCADPESCAQRCLTASVVLVSAATVAPLPPPRWSEPPLRLAPDDTHPRPDPRPPVPAR